MASVLPKVGYYTFLSIICLLINFSLLFTVVISNDAFDTNDFDIHGVSPNLSNEAPDYNNATLSDFAVAGGGSFVPFFSLYTIANYFESLPLAVTVITGIITSIIGAFQIFLLSIIIINMLPKVLGSGFDV